MIDAFTCPHAIKMICFDLSIVLIPMVIAIRGTWLMLPKS